MVKRLAWIIIGTIILVVIACIAGCAARTITAAVPTGTAVPTGPAAFTATIERAPRVLASVSVDARIVPRCSDSLKAPCWQTFSLQGLNYQTLRPATAVQKRQSAQLTQASSRTGQTGNLPACTASRPSSNYRFHGVHEKM